MSGGRPHGRSASWPIGLVMAGLLPFAALAQGADELASMIEQSLSGIEYRIDLRPKLAAQDLREQQRRLELLEQQAPDNPALPALKQKFAALQAEIAANLADAPQDPATGGVAAEIPSPPEAFTSGLEEVDALQKQAEEHFLMGDNLEAAEFLEQAEGEIAALEQRYGDQIPKGHATLIVTKEKLAALRDQLAQAKAID